LITRSFVIICNTIPFKCVLNVCLQTAFISNLALSLFAILSSLGSASSPGFLFLADWLDGKLTVNPTICTDYNNHLPPVSITLGGTSTSDTSTNTANDDNNADDPYDGNTWELPLNNSRLLYIDSNGFCAFAVQAASSTILGNVAMGGLTVVFDQSAHLIGFAEGANCDASLSKGNFSWDALTLVPGTDDDSQPASAATSPIGWLLFFALFICIAIGIALGCQNVRCKSNRCLCCCRKPDPPLPFQQQGPGGRSFHAANKSTGPTNIIVDRNAHPPPPSPVNNTSVPPPKPPRRFSGISTTTTSAQEAAHEKDISSNLELADVYN